MREGATRVAAGTPKNGTKAASRSPKSISGRLKKPAPVAPLWSVATTLTEIWPTSAFAGVPEKVRADRTRVKQILFNLLNNAVKFSDRGVVVLDLRRATAEDGREVLALFAHKDHKRWVLWTPEGFYAASAPGQGVGGGEELLGQPHNLIRHPDMPPHPSADNSARAGTTGNAYPSNLEFGIEKKPRIATTQIHARLRN